MADFGTANGRDLAGTLTPGAPGTFTPGADPSFDINASIGTISGRQFAMGAGGGIEYVDRPVYTPIPPSAESVGDWPMRFFLGQMEPSTVVSEVENIPDYYVCPASSKLYVRYYEVRNYSGEPATVSINMADYPVERAETVADGAVLSAPEGFNMILWPGDVIEGKIQDDADDVWLLITGVETVT